LGDLEPACPRLLEPGPHAHRGALGPQLVASAVFHVSLPGAGTTMTRPSGEPKGHDCAARRRYRGGVAGQGARGARFRDRACGPIIRTETAIDGFACAPIYAGCGAF